MLRKTLLSASFRNSILFLQNSVKREHLNPSYFLRSASFTEIPCYASKSTNDYDLSDDDLDSYEIKYDLKKDQGVSKSALITKLKYYLDTDEKKIREILKEHKSLLKMPINTLTSTVEQLYQENISQKTLRENPWMLAINFNYIKSKIEILQQMEPKDINDLAPLLKCSPIRLKSALMITKKERKHIPNKSRIYYMSNRLGVEPATVCKYVSTHMFMFDIGFDMLVENLNIQLEYKIAPINILRDLWAFKYLPKSVRARLERAKQAKKEKLMPWMVRCPEPVLQKSLQISVDCRNLLGENNDVIDYLSKRLGYDVETTRFIAMRHESVLKVRVTKVKEILDYLLEEEKFEPHEIASCPRILCHSLETTKSRINELKTYGCRPTALVIVCKSKNEYEKFVANWVKVGEQLQSRKV